jgi:hypothetical protein
MLRTKYRVAPVVVYFNNLSYLTFFRRPIRSNYTDKIYWYYRCKVCGTDFAYKEGEKETYIAGTRITIIEETINTFSYPATETESSLKFVLTPHGN